MMDLRQVPDGNMRPLTGDNWLQIVDTYDG